MEQTTNILGVEWYTSKWYKGPTGHMLDIQMKEDSNHNWYVLITDTVTMDDICWTVTPMTHDECLAYITMLHAKSIPDSPLLPQ